MKRFPFCYKKGAQVAATFLRFSPSCRMNYYRLLKLLYIADRRSIEETGRPIIGGRTVAMKRGPVHSVMLDLINGVDSESPNWCKKFITDRYDVEMIHDPGVSELTRYEIDLLNRISREFQDFDEWEVGDFTHSFKEFVNHKPDGIAKKVEDIPLEDIVNEVRPGQIAEVERDATELAVFDRIFGR